MTKEQTTSTGLNSKDLMLLRMLMQQQKYPTVTAPAINDVGSGISSAASQVFNALAARKEMAQQAQIMQSLLAQEQSNQERAAMADKQAAASLGVPYEQWAALPDAAKTHAFEQQQKHQEQLALANLYYQQGQQQVPTYNTMSSEAYLGPKNVAALSKDGASAANVKTKDFQPLQEPTVSGYTTQPTVSPLQATIAASLPSGEASKFLQQLSVNQPLSTQFDPNTPEGMLALQTLGVPNAPNRASMTQQNAQAQGSVYEALGKERVLPYLAPQAAANVDSTVASTDVARVNAATGRENLRVLPSLNNDKVSQSTITTNNALIGAQQNEASRAFLDGLTPEQLQDPNNWPYITSNLARLSGKDPIPGMVSTSKTLLNPSAGTSLMPGIQNMNTARENALKPQDPGYELDLNGLGQRFQAIPGNIQSDFSQGLIQPAQPLGPGTPNYSPNQAPLSGMPNNFGSAFGNLMQSQQSLGGVPQQGQQGQPPAAPSLGFPQQVLQGMQQNNAAPSVLSQAPEFANNFAALQQQSFNQPTVMQYLNNLFAQHQTLGR